MADFDQRQYGKYTSLSAGDMLRWPNGRVTVILSRTGTNPNDIKYLVYSVNPVPGISGHAWQTMIRCDIYDSEKKAFCKP